MTSLLWECEPGPVSPSDSSHSSCKGLEAPKESTIIRCPRAVEELGAKLFSMCESENGRMILKSLPWLFGSSCFLNGDVPQNTKFMTSGLQLILLSFYDLQYLPEMSYGHLKLHISELNLFSQNTSSFFVV